MNCKECQWKKAYRKGYNATQTVFCEHPNKEHIEKYFKDNCIHKMLAFIGFIDSKGEFPIKTAPKWCPLKVKGE